MTALHFLHMRRIAFALQHNSIFDKASNERHIQSEVQQANPPIQ